MMEMKQYQMIFQDTISKLQKSFDQGQGIVQKETYMKYSILWDIGTVRPIWIITLV